MGCGRIVAMSKMLPSPPKSLGMLGDVLISAFSAVQGDDNSLGFASRQSICVLLIDGLGFHNLVDAAGHARFLNSQPAHKGYCYFPSTTSTSLTSFATGRPPNETSFLGYNIFDRVAGKKMNLLSGWEDQESASAFQRLDTVSHLARNTSVSIDVVSQGTYQFTGLTAATMPHATFHVANSIEERFDKAIELLATGEQRVVYLYIPELDQTAHHLGVKSKQWLDALEAVDALTRVFVSKLPKHSGLVITSDHGVIDVAEHEKLYLDELLPEAEMLFVGGDTRGLMIYLAEQSATREYLDLLEAELGDYCYIVTPEQVAEAGYLADLGDRPEIVPDIWVIARKNVALYHRAFARPKSLYNIGHHGSISENELAIPIIRFNC